MLKDITIREGKHSDLIDLQHLFVDTVSAICSADYDSQQIQVWISSVENHKRWDEIMKNQLVLVAENETEIVGFTTLDNKNYLDLLYVHKDFQRQGIARKLYREIEKEAIRLEQTALTADVSKTAGPFFESLGFKIVNEQTVVRQNVELTNYKMMKVLINQ